MKVDVVLSGGGIRGFAHVGVLKALEEQGIQVARIAGCSVGALIGAMYASNQDAAALEAYTKKIKFYRLPDISLSKMGLIKGDKIKHVLDEYIQVKKFEDLKIPLIVNATNLRTGKETYFDSGPLFPALQASMAFPGMITPKIYRGTMLVDGGVTNPVPLNALDPQRPVVISDVAINLQEKRKDITIVDTLKQSLNILQQVVVDFQLKESAHQFVHIKPDLHEWGVFEVKNDPQIIERGYQATRKKIPFIKRMFI